MESSSSNSEEKKIENIVLRTSEGIKFFKFNNDLSLKQEPLEDIKSNIYLTEKIASEDIKGEFSSDGNQQAMSSKSKTSIIIIKIKEYKLNQIVEQIDLGNKVIEEIHFSPKNNYISAICKFNKEENTPNCFLQKLNHENNQSKLIKTWKNQQQRNSSIQIMMDKNEQFFLLNEETNITIQDAKTNRKQTDILNNGIQSLNFISGSTPHDVQLLLSIPKIFQQN